MTDEQVALLRKAYAEERRGYEIRLIDAEGEQKKALQQRIADIDRQVDALGGEKSLSKMKKAELLDLADDADESMTKAEIIASIEG